MRRRRYLSLAVFPSVVCLAGCTGGENDDDEEFDRQAAYRNAFRDSLEHNGLEIRELAVENQLVELEYAPGELSDDPTEAEVEDRIEESIGTTVGSYFDRIHGPGDNRWEVDRLNATVVFDGSVVATWHLETEWIFTCVDRDDIRSCLGEKVEATVERHDGTPESAE